MLSVGGHPVLRPRHGEVRQAHRYDSPLRHRPAASTCLAGGHAVWWRVEAESAAGALELLPRYVRTPTTVTGVRDVEIP